MNYLLGAVLELVDAWALLEELVEVLGELDKVLGELVEVLEELDKVLEEVFKEKLEETLLVLFPSLRKSLSDQRSVNSWSFMFPPVTKLLLNQTSSNVLLEEKVLLLFMLLLLLLKRLLSSWLLILSPVRKLTSDHISSKV